MAAVKCSGDESVRGVITPWAFLFVGLAAWRLLSDCPIRSVLVVLFNSTVYAVFRVLSHCPKPYKYIYTFFKKERIIIKMPLYRDVLQCDKIQKACYSKDSVRHSLQATAWQTDKMAACFPAAWRSCWNESSFPFKQTESKSEANEKQIVSKLKAGWFLFTGTGRSFFVKWFNLFFCGGHFIHLLVFFRKTQK